MGIETKITGNKNADVVPKVYRGVKMVGVAHTAGVNAVMVGAASGTVAAVAGAVSVTAAPVLAVGVVLGGIYSFFFKG